MNQTRLESLIEACVNTVFGFLVTITFLPVINWICDIEMTKSQMTSSTALFTLLSVARGYVVRRSFNNLYWIKNRIKRLFIKEYGND